MLTIVAPVAPAAPAPVAPPAASRPIARQRKAPEGNGRVDGREAQARRVNYSQGDALVGLTNNPDWWVVKILDGFGPHTSYLEAMQVFSDAKIIILKEEGVTSHVCQAYDQECAKADKRSMRTSLALLRQTTQLTKGVIDDWQLVNVALAAVRELEASTWIASFKKVSSDVVLFCAATPDHHNP